MNHREPTFRGGPGQREMREKAAKLRAAASASAVPEGLSAKPPRTSSPARKGTGVRGDGVRKEVSKKAAPPRPSVSRGLTKAGFAVRGPYEEESCKGSAALDLSGRVRMTTLKNIIGVFFLPAAWVWTASFAGLFSRATVHQRFWMTEDFWFFMLGVVLWLLAFSGSLYLRGEPPLLKFYVRVHEYTHAIWTWLSNGEVGEIKINDDHGHILTNKPTVLVTLAPYFYPLPCVLLIIGFLVFQLIYPLDQAPPIPLPGGSLSAMAVFLLLMGMGWGFHCSYTVWMIRKGQSDLRMHGNFFSLVVIYLVNLLVVTLFLILMAPGVEWKDFGRALLLNAEEFSEVAWSILLKAFEGLRSAAIAAAK